MTSLYNIPTHEDSPEVVNAVVEIEKGSSTKYEYDPKLEAFVLDRCLMSAMVYPANYGFIPGTLADDGDALDILVYNAIPVQRGTVVPCTVIGCLHMIDGGEQDYKVIGCPTSHVKKYKTLKDIDPLFLDVAENFFKRYKEIEGKHVSIGGWLKKNHTYEIIKQSIVSNK